MDSYIQLYVDSKKVSKKFLSHHYPDDFLVHGSDGGGTVCLLFWNLHKIWI